MLSITIDDGLNSVVLNWERHSVDIMELSKKIEEVCYREFDFVRTKQVRDWGYDITGICWQCHASNGSHSLTCTEGKALR